MRDGLARRDIGTVFRFLHQRGWSWAAIAQATDIGEQDGDGPVLFGVAEDHSLTAIAARWTSTEREAVLGN